jgi:uncharacterized Ntn-hydrolase superfamily protein
VTYSIVARDPATGELGVAVESHFFAVGPVVPWLRPGVGAVATQAMAELSYGPLALDLLEAGRSPSRALEILTEADPGAATRQVAVVDAAGAVAVHTGECCIAEAGHRLGEGWAVQANMMTSPGVPDAMAEAFLAAGGPLADRMLAALDAAEAAGGDIRGRQSAALVVVRGDAGSPAWDNVCDVRVDDHPEPLVELRRLVATTRCSATTPRCGSGRPFAARPPATWPAPAPSSIRSTPATSGGASWCGACPPPATCRTTPRCCRPSPTDRRFRPDAAG